VAAIIGAILQPDSRHLTAQTDARTTVTTGHGQGDMTTQRGLQELPRNGIAAQVGPAEATPFALRATVFILLIGFYLLTAPGYHTTAVDSYNFAHLIVDRPYKDASNRLFLWLTAAHGLYDLVALIVPDPDPFLVIGFANAIVTSLTVVLMQSLLRGYLRVSDGAAWLTALIFAVSYGTWRYATELEVYPFAALAGVILLHLAFRAGEAEPSGRTKALLATAVFGALATLAYQPMGIVAGFAIPAYLLLRCAFWPTVTYVTAYGGLTGAGMILIGALRSHGEIAGAAGMLDTDGKLPVFPPLIDLGLAVVAFGQNLLSFNWAFMFQPTSQVIDERFRDQFIQELVASEQSYLGQSLYLLTLPVAAALAIVAFVVLLRRSRQPRVSAAEAGLLVWLGVHSTMAILLQPTGFETWLPALVPFLLLAGIRVVGPLVDAGWRIIPILAIATMLVHNWFAGVGFFAMADKDYNVVRGEPVLSIAATADLFVIDTNWAFERYLNYTGTSSTYLIQRNGIDDLDEAAQATLAAGGRVFVFDDVFAAYPDAMAAWPDATRLAQTAERIDLGGLGYALVVKPPAP
jgi:hypothetical protein